jgi:hypothetical protein
VLPVGCLQEYDTSPVAWQQERYLDYAGASTRTRLAVSVSGIRRDSSPERRKGLSTGWRTRCKSIPFDLGCVSRPAPVSLVSRDDLLPQSITRIGNCPEILQQLIDAGILTLDKIPPDIKLTEPQKIQVQVYRSGESILDKEAIARDFGELNFLSISSITKHTRRRCRLSTASAPTSTFPCLASPMALPERRPAPPQGARLGRSVGNGMERVCART